MTKNQEKIKDALERIDKALETIDTDEGWLKFLKFQSLFYHYSFCNTMLIYMQNPDATYVKGYKAWNKLGRHVRKGEKGIMIIAPCFNKVEELNEPDNEAEYHDKEAKKDVRHVLKGFKTTHVFDIGQTEGDDQQLPVLVSGLSGCGKTELDIYKRLKAFIEKRHPVEETASGTKGAFNTETGIIYVRSDLDDIQKIKTLLHEFAHCVDFEMRPDKDISRNRRELVAESVAFIVSLHLGIDTSAYSMGYLKTWMVEKDEMKAVSEIIQKVSAYIIDELGEFFESQMIEVGGNEYGC